MLFYNKYKILFEIKLFYFLWSVSVFFFRLCFLGSCRADFACEKHSFALRCVIFFKKNAKKNAIMSCFRDFYYLCASLTFN